MRRVLAVASLLVVTAVQPLGAIAEDLLRICYAHYPGCTLYIFDYRYTPYDFSALWCGGEFIYEQEGFGGRIGSGSECVYFT